MPMNKLKNHGLIPLLLLAVISITSLAVETPGETPEVSPETATSEETTQASPQSGDDVTVPQPATETVNAAALKPIKPFKPTEQIEADSAVTFPIDI